MSNSLQQRICALVLQVIDQYSGAWMVWCDPRGDWAPLLNQTASDDSGGGFTLVPIDDVDASTVGSPLGRRDLQARLDAGESFVLYVRATADNLGWLWAQALLAEQIYAKSLREQLSEWGWRPHRLTLTEDELAVLARQGLRQDPAEWGANGLQPDTAMLLEVLAGATEPDPDERLILDLSVEQAGLPPLDSDDLNRWRLRCLGRLLVTQAHAVAPALVGDGHELLVAGASRDFALDLLNRWTDSLRLRRRLPDAILEADRIAALGTLLRSATINNGPFLSYAAERTVFANTCASLSQKTGKDLLEALASLEEDIARHADGFWGNDSVHPQAIPWDELLRLSRVTRTLLGATPTSDWASPASAIAWYVGGGWKLDQAGEEVARPLTRPSPELLALVTPLRAAYRARWESTLIQWSEVWSAAGCPIPDLSTAGTWLAQLLRPSRATAIVFVDALRYDLGATLAERLNQREGAERATVSPARAPLPSITPLGMGMALPISEDELVADLVDRKWQLFHTRHDVNLSSADQRRAWLQEHAGIAEDAFLSVTDVLTGTVPAPAPQRTRLVITDAVIDKLGHDDELEALGTGLAVDRYLGVIERLRDADWLRILIVTDHGYIHVPTSEERNVPPPAPEPAYSSRRALAYPAGMSFDSPQALAPGGRWRIALPRGAASFRAYGGLGYFHGGASLQEWIIPCIRIEWPLQVRPVRVELQPIQQVLSQRPRVTLLVDRGSLFIEDAIPRQVEVIIREASQRTILFRSEPVSVAPDQEQVSITLRVADEVVAERGTRLHVEVRDSRTEEVLSSGESTLMIDLTGW